MTDIVFFWELDASSSVDVASCIITCFIVIEFAEGQRACISASDASNLLVDLSLGLLQSDTSTDRRRNRKYHNLGVKLRR